MRIDNLKSILEVTITTREEMIGMAPAPGIYTKHKESAVDPETAQEEYAALCKTLSEDEALAALVEKGTTFFPKEDGKPFFWDYQIRGAIKDSWGLLRRCEGTFASSLTAYKKVVDGLVFVKPRKIFIQMPEGGTFGICERPLRVSTSKGEMTALARGETIPEGAVIKFTIEHFEMKGEAPRPVMRKGKPVLDENGKPKMTESLIGNAIEEWLDYGTMRGLGQWRNSGKGVFEYSIHQIQVADPPISKKSKSDDEE